MPAHDDWTRGLAALDDHDLLLGGVADAVAENRAAAQKWLRLLTYYRRREAEDTARAAAAPDFALTARQQTAVEVGELWGMSECWTRKQLNVALCLSESFPFLFQLCLAGQCDTYRATLVADLARHALDRPAELALLGRRLESFLRKHLRRVDGLRELCGVDAVVCCTRKQLRNKLSYEIRKLKAPDAEDEFRKAYAGRTVTSTDREDGMSCLTVHATTDQVLLARHRLTLAAKQLRAAGDGRTLDQLRSDLAIDLLTGRVDGVPIPAYARPVVNLTVPVQTVMGLSDDPGMLSGGTVLPAGLARRIAQTPGATWRRMLTDPAGRMVELSTMSYQPTKGIWTHVVAEATTCFRPGCDTASTECDLDHREPWPEGATTPANLWPACRTDHRAKHSPGFRIEQTASGSYALRTPAGFVHEIDRDEHPASTEFGPGEAEVFQFSATEIRDAIAHLRQVAADTRPPRHDLDWEYEIERLWETFHDVA